MRRWRKLVVSCLAVSALLAASAALAASSQFIGAMNTGTIVTLDPAACYEVEGHWLLDNIYDSLVKFKPGSASEIQPNLATEWKIEDKKIIFTIRDDAVFSNGDPVTPEDVAYSLKRVVRLAKSPSWILTQFGVTEESITTDGNKVIVEMDDSYSPQLVLSCMTYISGVVNSKQAKANEKDGDMGSAWIDNNSAGSGPYMLESWNRNEKIVLKANPHYWGEKPKIQEIVLIDTPESSSQLLQLKGGSVHMAWNLEYDQIPEVEKNEGLYAVKSPLFRMIYLGMNASREPLNNVKVRQAIKHAIDTEGIIQATGGGVFELHSFVPKGMFSHYDGNPFPYDPKKARELLAEAGYPNGFSVQLTVPDFLSTEGTIVKANLDAVGIKTDLQVIAYTTLLGKYREQGLELVLARWGADYGDPDAMAKPFAHCRTTGPEAKIKQLAWRNGYANPELTDMVEKAAFIQDREEREKLYVEIQKRWLEEGPFKILYQFAGHVGLSEKVKNFTLSPLTETPLNLLEIEG